MYTFSMLYVLIFLILCAAVFGGIMLKKAKSRALYALLESVEKSGEEIRLEPIYASYRGALNTYSKVKNNGYLLVSDKHIFFKPVFGSFIRIPIGDITRIDYRKVFRGSSAGVIISIIITADNEIGFIIKNPQTLEQIIKK